MNFADILKNTNIINDEDDTIDEDNVYVTNKLDSIKHKKINLKFHDNYGLILFDYFQNIKEDMDKYILFCYEHKTKLDFNYYEFMLWLQKFIVLNKNDSKNIISEFDFSDEEYYTEYSEDS